MGKCQFRPEWLKKVDSNDCVVSEWARKHSDVEAFCSFCNKTFSILKGFQAIEQHSSTVKHREGWLLLNRSGQLRISAVRESETSENAEDLPAVSNIAKVQIFSTRDATAKAELIWVLKCISSDFPAASCDGVRDTFNVMFPTAVSNDFSLSRTKFRYLVSDALAPHFRAAQLKDVSDAVFTLCYDETTNSAGKKELQTTIRYWSEQKSQVVATHLQTFFIGSATAEDLLSKLNEALDHAGLPRKNLLMLGSDGPNVNKKVERLMNEQLLDLRKKSLLNIGTCNIHTLHNGFQKGVEELGEDASELIIAVYHFFNGWPLRLEDFEKIQQELGLPTNRFIKHVASRWLTLEQAADRIIQQWSALVKYFTSFVPKKRVTLSKTASFSRIVRFLNNPTMRAEMLFVASSARIFTRFTGFFQREEPLIHLMFSELERLLRTIVGRTCKADVWLANTPVPEDIFDNIENLLPSENIIICDEAMAELAKAKPIDKLKFLNQAKKHYVAAGKHVLKKSGLQTPFIKYCQCLNPSAVDANRSSKNIIQVAKALPSRIDYDLLADEWNLLKCESVKEKSTEWRVEDYWNQFFILKTAGGQQKYPLVAKVIKAALATSHGNADVERGFSTSGRILTDDRASMSERTLNAFLTVKSTLKSFGNKPHVIPIPKDLLMMAHKAHANYKLYLEEERQKKAAKEEEKLKQKEQKEAEEKNKKQMQELKLFIEKKEEQLKALRKEEEEKKQTADRLFAEANSRLKKAIEKRDMKEVELAQAMLEGVSTVRKQQESQKRAADNAQQCVEKKKGRLITSFFVKKPSK